MKNYSTNIKIKVALIDNMNNNFFSLCRYLRDAGLDAHLYEIINTNADHFNSQADTYVNLSDVNYIHKFPVKINSINWVFFRYELIKREFNEYDIVIACGLSCEYLCRCGINIDIVIPYGSDLYEYPFLSFNINQPFISLIHQWRSRWQLKAFTKARVVITNLNHRLYKASIDKMKIHAINSGIPMLYSLEELPSHNSNWDFLKKSDFIVFNHSRQMWFSNPNNLFDFNEFKGNKRNDKTIKAFSNFLKITKFKTPFLVLFNYGPDVEQSKQLIDDLEITKNIKWIKKSNRKDIMYGLNMASLGVDQIRENICGIGGVGYEVLASGKPLLTHTDGALTKNNNLFYDAPIVDVLTETDILNVFIDYEKNTKKYEKIGIKSKEWFNQYLGKGLSLKYVKLIKILASDKLLNQNDKIIREIFNN